MSYQVNSFVQYWYRQNLLAPVSSHRQFSEAQMSTRLFLEPLFSYLTTRQSSTDILAFSLPSSSRSTSSASLPLIYRQAKLHGLINFTSQLCILHHHSFLRHLSDRCSAKAANVDLFRTSLMKYPNRFHSKAVFLNNLVLAFLLF